MIIVREIEPMQQVTQGLPPAYYQQPADMLENIIILRIQKFVLPFLDWIPVATRYRTDNGKKWNYPTKVPSTYLEVNFSVGRDRITVPFVYKNVGII